MIWRMVASIRQWRAWPLPATCAVSSATWFTSFMVLTNSREVAEISLEVAPISAVVAAISFAVLCCSRAVAAISVAVVFTWMPERWTWPTRTDKSSASRFRPSPTTPNSSFAAREPFGKIALAHAFQRA